MRTTSQIALIRDISLSTASGINIILSLVQINRNLDNFRVL